MIKLHSLIKDGIAILGQTGIGKTSVAIEVAKRVNGEVIGLDSRQIYKGFEIGTAQPTIEERDSIPHHLIGTRDPLQEVAAGEYANMVIEISRDIQKRGKVPVICGGAGLYYRALTKGLFKDSATFPEIRSRLEAEYDSKGGDELLKRLKKLDPEYACIVHPNNKKRMVRALEIYEGTGVVPTEHFKKQSMENDSKETIEPFAVLLKMENKTLHKRLKERTSIMFQSGWLDEVKVLLKEYGDTDVTPLDSIGYREIRKYLNESVSMDELQEDIYIKTRQYAKRQRQWFSSEKIDMIFNLTEKDSAFSIAEKIVNFITQT